MLQKIYVGNLSWGSSEESLKTLCEPFGSIADAFIVRDRLTGKSRGFGFVEFASKDSADKAVEKLNGSQVDGRSIKVNFAEEKPPKSRF
ncbi:RNP-1 like RNA-binding protein [Globomyces pollinis-pini]|nr:RNP-1 like RNA-binding protein [Globomyces pollinis-pini]